ncbi:Hpt domain-containing protein [Hyphomicrobium sp.]|uniref:Hpt domain-containing protein n=1 Tax=Hyphomicrobium sp. TaxID=82 RepID=UPI002E343C2C|nr:Hpt domain-containing protein [Hyphomicrobium sp.]HEX2839739.1 Hpt domain-containing protein [Hyphomicrobium sp.]
MGPAHQDMFVLRCEGSLTLAGAAESRARVLQALDHNQAVLVDISEIDDLDVTFVQIALAAQKSVAAKGKQIFIGAPADSTAFQKLQSAQVSPADMPSRIDPPAPAAAAATEDNIKVDTAAIATLINEIGATAVRQSLDVFFSEMTARLASLEQLSADADVNVIRREAHLLKGSAATFGLTGLAADVAMLERDAGTLTADAYKATVARMAAALRSSQAILHAVANAA